MAFIKDKEAVRQVPDGLSMLIFDFVIPDDSFVICFKDGRE
ncbi:hypothetical protein [Bhargavaea cecembensis]|nr:hypothetical protein [Bhargavaea cecembensis]